MTDHKHNMHTGGTFRAPPNHEVRLRAGERVDCMPTQDEMWRVRRLSCRLHGHYFDVVVQLGTGEPQGVICNNCGRSWPVQPEGD